MQEYSEEIERLKRDLLCAREKNGVYLASETYQWVNVEECERACQWGSECGEKEVESKVGNERIFVEIAQEDNL